MSADIKTWQERAKLAMLTVDIGIDNRSGIKSRCMAEEIADLRAALAAATAPQPVAGDERGLFEAGGSPRGYVRHPDAHSYVYVDSITQAQWEGWQARADQSTRQIATLHAVIEEQEKDLAQRDALAEHIAKSWDCVGRPDLADNIRGQWKRGKEK